MQMKVSSLRCKAAGFIHQTKAKRTVRAAEKEKFQTEHNTGNLLSVSEVWNSPLHWDEVTNVLVEMVIVPALVVPDPFFWCQCVWVDVYKSSVLTWNNNMACVWL